MKITYISTGSIKSKLGFIPCVYVYEGNKFLWKQTEPINFLSRDNANEYANKMKNEILTMNTANGF